MFKIHRRTPAGLRVNDLEVNGIERRDSLPCKPRRDGCNQISAHAVIIRAAGREMRDQILRLLDAVKAGDDAIARDKAAVRLQIGTDTDRHCVICADDRVRDRAVFFFKPPFHCSLRGTCPEAAVSDQILAERDVVFPECSPESDQAVIGKHIILNARHHIQCSCAVRLDHMAAQPLKHISVGKGEADAARKLLINGDHRDARLQRLRDHIIDHWILIEKARKHDDCGELFIGNHPKDSRFADHIRRFRHHRIGTCIEQNQPKSVLTGMPVECIDHI